MASMDLLSDRIVEEIEAYITEDNLKSDSTLANHIRENDGWIRLELLTRCNKLSSHNYDTILYALSSKPSNIIELSSFEPRCIRQRCPPLTGESIQDTQTVVITGLPFDVRYEELIEFFNRFYPVKEIIKIYSSSNSFNGKIHVIFHKSSDAFAFVEQSKLTPIVYVNNHLLQSCDGYTIVCNMLNDQHNLIKGKSFSTRLTNSSSRPNHSLSKSGLKSNTSATEQILFCQNLPDNKSRKSIDYDKQKIVLNKFLYEFYIPDHLLKQIHPCVIISVLNPYCFTIQLRQDALEFDKFQREINDFYNTLHDHRYDLTPEQIRLNLCVICRDTKSSDEKKIWNRSQILDFDPSDNTVNLFYVDLGTWEEYVPINRLRHITDRFHRHLVFSITCRLVHIIPFNNENDQLTWTDEATNQFLAVIDQNSPEIEFLSFNANGCFHINLFVMNSGQHVCVNDYMIHIKKAKASDSIINIDDDGQNSLQSDEHDTNGHGPPIHPVIALYNRFGEALQQSISESRTTSISSSSIPSPSTLPRLYLKLIHVNIATNTIYNTQPQLIPIIFVHYQKTILIPDFNIATLLQLINPNFDLHTIEQYAYNIRYNCIHITQESNFDIFTQLSSLINMPYSSSIALYTLDFVDYILKHYHFRLVNVFLAIENARRAQLHAADLALWFTRDNELRFPIPPVAHQPSIPYRLPFSNRLINPM